MQITEFILSQFIKQNQLDSAINTAITERFNNFGFGVKFITADTQYQTQVSTPVVNGTQVVTARELQLHQIEDEKYLTDLANQIASAQFTDAQKQQLAADILAQVGETAVTADAMTQAINAAITAVNTPEMTVLDNENCHLLFAKYQNGIMTISGYVMGDGIQVIFPTGYNFIDPTTVGPGVIYSDLEDQSNSVMHVGKIQISANSILWKASSFGLSLIAGVPVSDDNRYSVALSGRWK